MGAAGAGMAIKQLMLQQPTIQPVAVCSPGITHVLNNFPLTRISQTLLAAPGNCADIAWTFWGISLAGWGLIFFGILLLLAVVQLFRLRLVNK